MTPPLTNPRAERIRAARQLSHRSARAKSGRMLVEGPQAVREAVRFAPRRIRDIYVATDAIARWSDILAEALAADRYVHPCDPGVFARISGDAQGIAAVVDIREATLADVMTNDDDEPRPPRLVVVCEELADPGNAGTIIRAADAAGADGVVLTAGSADVTSPKVIRSSAGSVFHIPVVRGLGLAETLQALREDGVQILAADGAGAADLDSPEVAAMLTQPTAWVMGNEAHGLSEDARELADAVVRIPIRGHAESLNVAMAATVLLFASARAQHGARRP